MTKEIETVNEIVAALGGPGRTAVFLGVGASAVSNWLADGEIPRGHHLAIYLALRRRELPINLSVFQLPDRILEAVADQEGLGAPQVFTTEPAR